MRQHHKVAMEWTGPEADEAFPCPHCQKNFSVWKSMREHSYVCPSNPARKGPFFCRVPGCAKARPPLQLDQKSKCPSLWCSRVGREEGLKSWIWFKVNWSPGCTCGLLKWSHGPFILPMGAVHVAGHFATF